MQKATTSVQFAFEEKTLSMKGSYAYDTGVQAKRLGSGGHGEWVRC